MPIKADFHVHTCVSDGRDPPELMVKAAARVGLNAIAITDHDTFNGAVKAKKHSKDRNIIVLKGNEVKTDKGEIIILCHYPIKTPKELYELIEKAREEGCVLIAPHPFDHVSGIGDLVYELPLDAYEIYNAKTSFTRPWNNWLSKKNSNKIECTPLANTDAHVWELLGSAYNIVDAEESEDEILDAIRLGRVHTVIKGVSMRGVLKSYLWSLRRSLGAGKRC